ncbi:hypothetical protein ACFV6E_36445 [Streptomyces sp. NPDC059785]|uniref:hypothetical protein n=1 Tax=Streptomyces sp. NPDC059785 TaxID=3346945 RepID=UPI0036520046
MYPSRPTAHQPPDRTALQLQCERLETGIQQLKAAVTSHTVIDQAIGALTTPGLIPPDELHQALTR